MENGLFTDITINDYHEDREYLSSTRVKTALKSMKHFNRYRWATGRKDAFELGNAFETLLLESEKFFDEVIIFEPENRPEQSKGMTSKINKEWKSDFFEDNESKIIISSADYNLIKVMVQECKDNKTIMSLIKESSIQVSIFWEDKNGLKLKTRPDLVLFLDNKKVIIIDVKSTIDASPNGFKSQCQKYNYPFQAIMQILGLESQGWGLDKYLWLAVEKNESVPMAQLYQFVTEDIDSMRATFNNVSEKIVKGSNTGYDENCEDTYGIRKLKFSDYYLENK